VRERLIGVGLIVAALLAMTISVSGLTNRPLVAALLAGILTLVLSAILGASITRPPLPPVVDTREMDAQMRRMLAGREELLRAVSHELRTPVARMSFAVELLAEQKMQNERDSRAAAIQDDIAELESLIAELMTYTSLEDEQLRSSTRPVDPTPLLARMVKQARMTRHQRTVQWDEQPVPPIEADRRLFTRALDNLMRNAVKYGMSTVRLSVDVGPRVVRFIVDDDGPGVPVGERARIFDALVRLDPARSRDTGGIGLGLSLARRIANGHGGRLTCTDSPLGGARFILSIPRVI
jgi:signal transduction histidine kinase